MSLCNGRIGFLIWGVIEMATAAATMTGSSVFATSTAAGVSGSVTRLPTAMSTSIAASATCHGSLTIHNTIDASSLASCTTWTGDVFLATSLPGEQSSIALEGIQALIGSLSVENNPDLVYLTADNLTDIGSMFILSDLPQLQNINFPRLTGVFSIGLQNLPQLYGMQFSPDFSARGTARVLNTSLTELSSTNFNLIGDTEILTIQNNPKMTSAAFSIVGAAGDGFGGPGIIIENNGPGMMITFPQLQRTGRMTINNATHVDMPVLSSTLSSIEIGGNELSTVEMPKLTSISGNLTLGNIGGLQSMNVSSLETVGGDLVMSGSRLLHSINLPSLHEVAGDMVLDGAFSSLNIPVISQVKGNVTMRGVISTICSELAGLKKENVVRGELSCTSSAANGGMRTSTKIGIGCGVSLGVIFLITLAFGALRLRKRVAKKKQREQNLAKVQEGPGSDGNSIEENPRQANQAGAVELPPHHGASELRGTPQKAETVIHELEGDDGATEMHQREKFSFEEPRNKNGGH